MPASLPPFKVLVTGANGFIAIWVVKLLLERGYIVRGTSRSDEKNAHLREVFASYVKEGKLELVVVEDITKPGAFDETVKGVDAIAHTASPFHFNADDPNELIEPAVKGTVGILESALKHAPSVKRVIVLSSCASVSNPSDRGILNESNWNTENIEEIKTKGREASQAAKYRASKSLAEKAAWDFVEQHKSEIGWDLVTLCPPFVFGPVLHQVSSPSALNTSVKDFYDAIIARTKPASVLESFQGSWIDVRDVAEAHVRSLEKEDAGGKRFIITSGNFVWQDFFDATNSLNITGVRVPLGTPGSGASVKHIHVYDTTRARTVLGLEFKTKEETARDSIGSFRERGW